MKSRIKCLSLFQVYPIADNGYTPVNTCSIDATTQILVFSSFCSGKTKLYLEELSGFPFFDYVLQIIERGMVSALYKRRCSMIQQLNSLKHSYFQVGNNRYKIDCKTNAGGIMRELVTGYPCSTLKSIGCTWGCPSKTLISQTIIIEAPIFLDNPFNELIYGNVLTFRETGCGTSNCHGGRTYDEYTSH